MKICIIKDCGREHKAKGFCVVHYERWKKYKNPYFRKCAANGEGCTDIYGYRFIYQNGKQVREHRVIMEKYLGRELLPFPKEIIHHINGITNDNRIENLEIISQSKHVTNH